MINDESIVTASNLAYYKKREEMVGILTVRYAKEEHMNCTFTVIKGLVKFNGAGEPMPIFTNNQEKEVIRRLIEQFNDFETRNYFHSPGSMMFMV